ncbi:MAG: type II secretion system secretin GspD, partial [Deltaproteobacteria bacterium]|nr:type II secretion system secretin GspD [Deltaproteobacteria bacterium]
YLSLDFTDVDLPVLIKFMSEQTRKNFIFDERVQGKVTIVSPRKMTEEEAYNVFLSVLQVKGFATVQVGNSIKIVPAREVRQESIPTSGRGKGALHSGEFVTRLVPLQHAESPEIVQLLTPLLSKDGMISAFASSNTVLLIDSRANIDRLMGIIRMVDTDSPGEMKIFKLVYAPAQDLAKTLELLFPTAAAGGAAPAPAVRGAARRIAGKRAAVAKFIPEPRTNNLIVIAPPEILMEVTDLVARLDVGTPSGEGRINVYYLENADAEEVAKVLSSLSGSVGTASAQAASPVRAPGQTAGQPASRGVIAAELEGGVKVTADKATNSLVIVASPNDYVTLVEVIKKLDIRRRQVFVEAAIMEIDLDKALDLGVEWRAATEVSNGSGALIGGTNFDFSGNINSLFTSLASGNPMIFSGTGLLAGGLGGTVKLPDGTEVPAIAAVLRAARTHTNLKILSSPHLLTQNNKEAEIIVGENVPFITSQSRDSTNLSNVINTVERKDVGITLKITPQIHESEFLSLDIYQESSALKDTTESTTVGPTTTKRSARTTVLVKSGDTVVIGGIMQETKLNSESKVPLLGDIPLLGHLFKYTSKSNRRTNLVILLTPHIISEPGALSEKLAERQRNYLDRFDQDFDPTKRTFQPRREEPRP